MKPDGDGEPTIESVNDSKGSKMLVGIRDWRCIRSPFSKLPVFNTPGFVRSLGSIKRSEYQTSDAEVPQGLADLVNVIL